MSTLSERTGNGTPTETSRQREETKEQIDGMLQQFDVLSSRVDRGIFTYIYVYLYVCTFWLTTLKRRKVDTGSQVQYRIGIAHEANQAHADDDDAESHVGLPR